MNKANYARILFYIVVISIILSCNGRRPKEQKEVGGTLTIYAAASLTDVVAELADNFERNYNVKIRINLASSGTLARQIEQGAEVDIYLSANELWVDYIDSLGFIRQGLRKNIAQNDLVLIAPRDSEMDSLIIYAGIDISALLGHQRLSVGDPSHVPAGRYAHQVFDYYQWNQVLKSKLLPAKDVRSALMMVEFGEVPLGIVYRTDALKSEKVKIIGVFAPKSHQPIVYIAGVCSDKPEAKNFLDFLNSDESESIWKRYGFRK